MYKSAWFRPALLILCLQPICSAHSLAQQSNGPASEPPKFEVNVVRVLVPVVVRDKHGQVVSDLKREDFQVFDNGKPHPLSGFTVEKHEAAANGVNSFLKAPVQDIPERSIVFLFDDVHMSSADLAIVQQAAAVSLSGKTNSGLTRDRSKLKQAIMSLRSHPLYSLDSAECPKIDYYEADLIENKHDSEATADAVRQVFDCSPGLDVKYNYNEAQSLADADARRILNLGHQDVEATYASISTRIENRLSVGENRCAR